MSLLDACCVVVIPVDVRLFGGGREFIEIVLRDRRVAHAKKQGADLDEMSKFYRFARPVENECDNVNQPRSLQVRGAIAGANLGIIDQASQVSQRNRLLVTFPPGGESADHALVGCFPQCQTLLMCEHVADLLTEPPSLRILMSEVFKDNVIGEDCNIVSKVGDGPFGGSGLELIQTDHDLNEAFTVNIFRVFGSSSPPAGVHECAPLVFYDVPNDWLGG